MASKTTNIINKMMDKDAFSQWLGIERVEESLGRVVLKMQIRADMLNGFGIAHGGISFAFADSAFAFASNSQGRKAVSIETSISHTQALKEGDVIFATAAEEHLSHKIGNYKVNVHKADGTLVAIFKGTVYRSSKEWITDEK